MLEVERWEGRSSLLLSFDLRGPLALKVKKELTFGCFPWANEWFEAHVRCTRADPTCLGGLEGR